MIGLLLGFLPFAKLIQMGLDITYSLVIKLLGLIFYLASEYWGRWVLAGVVVTLALCYGRYHYLHQGRAQEAKFCDLRIDDALRQAKRPKVAIPERGESFLDDWFKAP